VKNFARRFVLASTLVIALHVTSGAIQPVNSVKLPSSVVLQEGPIGGVCPPPATICLDNSSDRPFEEKQVTSISNFTNGETSSIVPAATWSDLSKGTRPVDHTHKLRVKA
jgi:hypothetical protein